MTRLELARRIVDVSLIRGEFRLRSGAVTREYFDKYRFESDPELLSAIADAMAELVPDDIDALAGLELGGVPLVTALSRSTGIPARFVRKKAKEHGTANLVEGGPVHGQKLVIVEDVVTSGGQVILSTNQLRELGATVQHALCVIDRESGASDTLSAKGIVLSHLFTMSELGEASDTE